MNETLRHQWQARVRQLSAPQREWLMDRVAESMPPETESEFAGELAAWLVVDQNVDDAVIREELSSRLSPALIPRRFVQLEALPKTASGKVDRNRLKLPASSRAVSSSDGRELTTGEQALIEICRTLLRVDTVTPLDHFAALGGDSMRSIQLIAMAREQGLALEPRDIHECDTIADLARVADARGRGVEESSPPQDDSAVVTEVRSGQRSGSILLVHEVGGQCHYSHHLAPILGTDRMLLVTRQPARASSAKSIEGLAASYVDAWLKANPVGPHVIVAFCWGGLLGYEIAKQMKARGVEPRRLIIIESGTEAAYAHAPAIHRWMDFSRGVSIRLRNRLGSLTSVASVGRLASSLARKLMHRSEPVTADSGFQFRDEEGDPEQIRDNVQAFLDYRIEPAEVTLNLFRVAKAAGLIGTRYSSRSFGWRYLVGRRLSITDVPGDHDTCMQPPNVEHLALEINRLLERD
ncbi:MAG: thioesterase domain-containing protein [Planctomycetota bacterium]